MSHRSDAPRPLGFRAVPLAIASTLVAVFAFSCADEGKPLVVGGNESNGTFAGIDASVDTPPSGANTSQCPSNECPAGKVTCANSPFPCSVDLNTDDENCGACGVRCPTDDNFRGRFNGTMRCIDGACRLSCDNPHADCNGLLEDGCEANLQLDDDKNCGACGNVCQDFCFQLSCGCPANQVVCNGTCVNINNNDNNCGACGNVCPPPTETFPASWHATTSCRGGQCNVRTCNGPRFADCNGNLHEPDGDGCETPVMGNVNNCLGCGNVCAPGEVCNPILGCICPCGAACDTSGRILSDPKNCGACGNKCPGDWRSTESPGLDPARGQPVCDDGICRFSCTPNWGNCDGNIDNGCETNFMSDPQNCGGCGVHCDGVEGQACVDGHCLTKPCGVVQ